MVGTEPHTVSGRRLSTGEMLVTFDGGNYVLTNPHFTESGEISYWNLSPLEF
jgi:hypothetical protein